MVGLEEFEGRFGRLSSFFLGPRPYWKSLVVRLAFAVRVLDFQSPIRVPAGSVVSDVQHSGTFHPALHGRSGKLVSNRITVDLGRVKMPGSMSTDGSGSLLHNRCDVKLEREIVLIISRCCPNERKQAQQGDGELVH